MRIAVTGANGYLGQGVVKKLLDVGHEVVAVDYAMDYVDSRAQKKIADIFKQGNIFDFLEKPDCVIHMAWRNGFVHNHLSHLEDLPSHYIFAKQLITDGLKQFVGIGSMHEIGFHEGSIKEDTPTNPLSLYGISKDALRRSLELLIADTDCKFQWLRGFYIVGNSQHGSSIFSKIAKAAADGKATFPFTTGENQWDFIDYEAFCEQVAAVVSQIEVCGIINICSGHPQKLSERVERFIQDNHYNIQLEYGVFPDRKYDSKAVWGDDSKIKMIMRHY